jgi:hypothetical protein
MHQVTPMTESPLANTKADVKENPTLLVLTTSLSLPPVAPYSALNRLSTGQGMARNDAGVAEKNATKKIRPRCARPDMFDLTVLPHYCTVSSSDCCIVLLK